MKPLHIKRWLRPDAPSSDYVMVDFNPDVPSCKCEEDDCEEDSGVTAVLEIGNGSGETFRWAVMLNDHEVPEATTVLVTLREAISALENSLRTYCKENEIPVEGILERSLS